MKIEKNGLVRTIVLIAFLFFFNLILATLANASNEEVGAIISNLFKADKVETGSLNLNERMEELEAFYQSRSFKPIWVRDDGSKGKAKALLVELNRSLVHGLDPGFYQTEKLSKLMRSEKPDELARLELLFSGALVDYGYDLANGHVDYKLAPEQVQIKPIIRSITEVLDGAEQAGELRTFVSSLLNVDDRYVRLLTKISEINRASSSRLWPKFSTDIPELELGNSHPEIVGIRTYLMLMGDFIIADFTERDEFDRPLQQAVISFQSRHGFPMTGKLDRMTLDEILLPIERMVEKISINLERRRWQNREIGQKHIYVNLSDNQARLVIDEEKVGEFELARQASDEQIPTFYGKITHMSLPKSGMGLQLVIMADKPDGSQGLKIKINLDGDAKEMAELISGEPGNYPSAASKHVELNEPVNIFVTYVTAWANKDGSIHFRQDRYNRDLVLEKYLAVN